MTPLDYPRRRHRVDGGCGARRSISREDLHPSVFWIAFGGFALMLATGQRLRPIGAADPDGGDVPDAGDLSRDARRRGFGLDSIWILPLLGLMLSDAAHAMVVARAVAMAARDVGDGGRRSRGRSSSSRSGFRAVDPAARESVEHKHRHRAVASRTERRLSRTRPQRRHPVRRRVVSLVSADARERFRREVLVPREGGGGRLGVVAIYQGFVDLTFLEAALLDLHDSRVRNAWPIRTSWERSMAFWTVGAIVLARRCAAVADGDGRRRSGVGRGDGVAVGIATGLAAVSGEPGGRARRSGSVLASKRTARMDMRRFATFGVIAIVVAVIAAWLPCRRASTHTIVAARHPRVHSVPRRSSILESANELLWERFGYGPAAIEMIKEHPIDGIGVGMFHALVDDFGKLRGYHLAPDNAQNWFRHVFAELGIVGSVPDALVVRRPGNADVHAFGRRSVVVWDVARSVAWIRRRLDLRHARAIDSGCADVLGVRVLAVVGSESACDSRGAFDLESGVVSNDGRRPPPYSLRSTSG